MVGRMRPSGCGSLVVECEETSIALSWTIAAADQRGYP